MIEIYRFNGDKYVLVAQVNETDGAVYGSHSLADHIRHAFEEIREYGYDPANNMSKIREKLERSYHNGLYLVI